MRILLDATVLEYAPTGIAKVTLGLYNECLRIHPSMEILAAHRRPLHGKLPRSIASVGEIPWLLPQLWRQVVPASLVLRRRPDLVHFPWNGQVPFLPGHPLVAITLHDVLPLLIPGYFPEPRLQTRYCEATRRDLQRADIIFTDSEFSKREILRNFTPGVEPTVLLYGPTLSSPPPNGDLPVAGEYFLYAGGYHPRKGLPHLLRVFLALHRQGKIRATLILAGSKLALSREFDEMVDEGKQRGILREMGYVTDDTLACLYANALALVYPSPYEGFGLPPLEAMSLGCPVITTRQTSLPEVCGEAVLYVDPDDEEALGLALMRVEGSGELRADLSRRGRDRALQFTWSRAAHTYLETVEAFLESRRPDRRGVNR